MAENTQEVQLTQAPEETPRVPFKSSRRDWAARVVIFLLFLFFASGKFNTAADGPWAILFKQIGIGQWFRYLTGALECLGAFLVLLPKTVEAGLALLAVILLGAMGTQIFALHRPADAFVAFALLCALVAFWLHRRRV
jgi:putative oxidoreductase